MTDVPPWGEVSLADYVTPEGLTVSGSQPWMLSVEAVYDLLRRQIAGEFRLRLILREAVDIRSMGKTNPTWIWDYEFGPEAILQAFEIVIVTRDGRRHRVKVPHGAPDMKKFGSE